MKLWGIIFLVSSFAAYGQFETDPFTANTNMVNDGLDQTHPLTSWNFANSKWPSSMGGSGGNASVATNAPDASAVISYRNITNAQTSYYGLSYSWDNGFVINTNSTLANGQRLVYAADVTGFRRNDGSINLWFIGLTNGDYTTHPSALYYIKSTNNGATFSQPAVVLAPNSVANTWYSGTVNSERAFYNPTNDSALMTVSGSTNLVGFVFGISVGAVGQIGIISLSSNADWSSSANYTFINAGMPVLTNNPSRPQETNGGMYAGNLRPFNGQWQMYYSTVTNTGKDDIYVAVSPDLTNWTKFNTPVTPQGAEEFNFIPLNDSVPIASSADVVGSYQATFGGVTYYPIWRSIDASGTNAWLFDSFMPTTLDTNVCQNFVGRVLAPAYGCYISDNVGGFWYYYSSLNSSGESFIGRAHVTLEPNHDLVRADNLMAKGIYVGSLKGTNNFFRTQGVTNPMLMVDTLNGASFSFGQTDPSFSGYIQPFGVNSLGGIISLGGPGNIAGLDFGGNAPSLTQNGQWKAGIYEYRDGHVRVGANVELDLYVNNNYFTTSSSSKGTPDFVITPQTLTGSNFVAQAGGGFFGNASGLTNFATSNLNGTVTAAQLPTNLVVCDVLKYRLNNANLTANSTNFLYDGAFNQTSAATNATCWAYISSTPITIDIIGQVYGGILNSNADFFVTSNGFSFYRFTVTSTGPKNVIVNLTNLCNFPANTALGLGYANTNPFTIGGVYNGLDIVIRK